MPWSEWIQSDPYERGTLARYKSLTQSGRTDYGPGDNALDVVTEGQSALYSTTDATTTVYGQNAGASPGAARSESAAPNLDGTWTGGVVQTQAVAWFDTGDLDLATWREWFPSELGDLTEGVDYEVRPDRTGTEDDAYIQYEDGAGEVDHWSAFAVGQIISHSASYSPQHDTVRWRLIVPSPTVPAIPPTNGSVGAPPQVFTPDTGSLITQIVNATTTGTSSRVFVEPTVPGYVSEWAVLMVTDQSSDVASTDPADIGYTHAWSATGLPASAAAYVRLPRWRYWIPGDLPLRQRQRDDGLALRGAPSWRKGTSRQATNRWRSYL